MKRLDRFILKAFIGPFVAILLVVLFVLVMQFLWVYVDELVGKGLGFKVIAEFLFWGGCTILPLALPLATLLSAMMTMGTLASNNELTALKASGVSVMRVMMPIILMSAVISVAELVSSNDLVPYSYNKIYTLREDIGRTKEEIKIPAGTFYDGIDGYVLRVDHTDDNGLMHGVIVYDHTSRNGNVSISIADSASMRMAKSKNYLTFVMYSGTNYLESNGQSPNDTTRSVERISFDRQEMIIPLENYVFEKSEETKYGDQIKSMNLFQLRHEQDSLREGFSSLHEAQMKKLFGGAHFVKNKQLDSAFFHKEGIQPFTHENYMQWESAERESVAYEKAAARSYEIINELNNYAREVYEYNYFLRRTDLEIYKKYSGALACLILFFIGAPLGALIRRGGLGTPALISALFFVIYWVIDLTGAKLAKNGSISPLTGAWIADAVLVPMGVLLTWKAIHDASFMNMDNFKSVLRTLKGRLIGIFRKTRIVYMGTPEFAVEPLQTLMKNSLKEGYKVVGVVTVADKPAGRGMQVQESAVKQYAVSQGLPVLQPVKLKDPEFLEQLRALKADLFVVVAFRMLPEEVWAMPRLGTFNLHAALLPQYRGAAPINWAVINGESMTGVTTFLLDKNIDTGAILLRQEHRIAPTDTAGDVHDALMHIGSDLVAQTVRGLIDHNIETRVQKSFIQGSESLKGAPKLTRETCHIDWNDTTEHIVNLIRGLCPYPTAFTELVREGEQPQQLKIFAAEKAALPETAEGPASSSKGHVVRDLQPSPGTVLSDGKSYLAIATADGAVSLKTVQLAGKKRMEIAAFLAGFRDPETYSATPGTSREICERARG